MPSKAGKQYIVLWLQGWTSSMDSHREDVERNSKQSGLAFATLDFAGHGLHKTPIEESTRQQQLDGVIAVYDELRKHCYNKVIVIGGSFGGYLAALLTGLRPVHAAVLRVPAMYADNELKTPHRETKKCKNPLRDQQDEANDSYIKDNQAVRSIRQFEGSTYVLEHELDEQVPKIMPKTYFANAKHGNYLLIPQATHSPKLMPNPKKYYNYIEHWLMSILEAIQLEDKLSD